ncbi:MAG TPA: hypothetical protein PLC83_12100 [Anaerolineaceae bacterium]|nr:hypothetical protein [Anaerolineaceae bacterium]HQO97812.1 hypothetical protein [Anaerolineaceae bacterium]
MDRTPRTKKKADSDSVVEYKRNSDLLTAETLQDIRRIVETADPKPTPLEIYEATERVVSKSIKD